MSSASQGPGWWQASDGNWYPPEQRAGYAAPPPPASSQPSYPPPAAAPYPPPGGQYPASGGPNFGNAQAAFASGVAKIPRAGWVVVGGLVAALIDPLANVSAEGILSIDVYWPGWAKFIGLLFVAGGLALTWATYDRLQTQQATLTGLSALVGLMIAHLILNWLHIRLRVERKWRLSWRRRFAWIRAAVVHVGSWCRGRGHRLDLEGPVNAATTSLLIERRSNLVVRCAQSGPSADDERTRRSRLVGGVRR